MLIRLHKAEKIGGLRVKVGVETVIVTVDRTGDGPRTLAEGRILSRAVKTVWLVVHGRAGVPVETHGSVAVVSMKWALRLVDRQGGIGPAAPVAVRVRGTNQARLKPLLR